MMSLQERWMEVIEIRKTLRELGAKFDEYDPSRIQSVRVSGSREITYMEYGEPNGFPVFYFHGTPSNHREAVIHDDTAGSLGIRLLAPDRPGCGGSDPSPGRRLLGWPDDVTAIANDLDIDRFAVVGVSGGGPYAAACAYAIPERLTGVAILSGIAPMDDPVSMKQTNIIDRFPIQLSRHRPHIARKLLRGATDDYRVIGEPWGFALEEITPDVDVWYGTKDRLEKPYHAAILAARIPNATLHTLSNTGHIASVIHHSGDVLAVLANDH